MAAQGWLRLGVATLDGRPAAAQLWFVKDGVALDFQACLRREVGGIFAGLAGDDDTSCATPSTSIVSGRSIT
jgi:hypothetical protein